MNNSLFNSTVLLVSYKLRIVLIFKLVLDISFVRAKTIKCFCWHGSKGWCWRRWWAGATHTTNLVISSEDFHIEYGKSLIDLENSYLVLRPGSSQNGRFQKGPGRAGAVLSKHQPPVRSGGVGTYVLLLFCKDCKEICYVWEKLLKFKVGMFHGGSNIKCIILFKITIWVLCIYPGHSTREQLARAISVK